jgi:hypothetical protein
MKRERTPLHFVLALVVKLLIGAGLLLTIVYFAFIAGALDVPRTTYNNARWWDVTITWNGVEFKLPPPWFRLGKTAQVPGTVTFFRDQFPWAEQGFSSITFKAPFSSDFAQNPEDGLRKWEQLRNKIWSTPNPYPEVIGHSYFRVHGSKNEFRCANTELQMEEGDKLMEVDCIEARSGWGFDYEGRLGDVTEAISILENGS